MCALFGAAGLSLPPATLHLQMGMTGWRVGRTSPVATPLIFDEVTRRSRAVPGSPDSRPTSARRRLTPPGLSATARIQHALETVDAEAIPVGGPTPFTDRVERLARRDRGHTGRSSEGGTRRSSSQHAIAISVPSPARSPLAVADADLADEGASSPDAEVQDRTPLTFGHPPQTAEPSFADAALASAVLMSPSAVQTMDSTPVLPVGHSLMSTPPSAPKAMPLTHLSSASREPAPVAEEHIEVAALLDVAEYAARLKAAVTADLFQALSRRDPVAGRRGDEQDFGRPARYDALGAPCAAWGFVELPNTATTEFPECRPASPFRPNTGHAGRMPELLPAHGIFPGGAPATSVHSKGAYSPDTQSLRVMPGSGPGPVRVAPSSPSTTSVRAAMRGASVKGKRT